MKILCLITPEDMPHIHYFQKILGGSVQAAVSTITPATRMEVFSIAKARGFEGIITTNQRWLEILVNWKERTNCNLDDFAGSLINLTAPNEPEKKLPVLVLNPLEQLRTTTAGEFIFKRYVSKLTRPQDWFKQTSFTWEVATPATLPALYARFYDAIYIGVDTETGKEFTSINCSGYCGVWLKDGKFETHTIVIPTTDEFMITWAGKFNALKGAKIFQNGMYDNAYFFRWGIPVYNWLWDTQHLFHSWYSELPKRLDFITAFCVRDIQYWKYLSNTDDLEQYYFYNAKDCWATVNTFLSIMKEAPQWAIDNYIEHEFPMVFPCLHTAMEGIQIDEAERAKIEQVETAKLQHSLDSLRRSINTPNFNPNSPKQVVQLWEILGSKDIKSSDKKAQDKVASRHPLNAWIVGEIQAYRAASKLLSAYTNPNKLLNGRFFASFNPAGTDTGRLASKGHHFWVGDSMQTIPEEVKGMFISDPDFELAEIDYAQSEARCVAYLSGDETLINVVESGRDYHCVNVELFFGIPYKVTWDEEGNRVYKQYKPIRDLAKRTNHGANYNMGAAVMLDTMGFKNVVEAKRLVEDSAVKRIMERNGWSEMQARLFWKGLSLKDVCQFLLDTYATIYKDVKGRWYDSIKYSIKVSSKLVSPLGWTRYCFGKPDVSKPALNAYVAHVPQNLSVSIINKAYFKIWRTIALVEPTNFRLKAQIHDSTFCQYRIGHKHLADKARELMKYPIEVIGSDGKKRILVIPTDMKSGNSRWSDLK